MPTVNELVWLCFVVRWWRWRSQLLCCRCCKAWQPVSQLQHAEGKDRMLSWWVV